MEREGAAKIRVDAEHRAHGERAREARMRSWQIEEIAREHEPRASVGADELRDLGRHWARYVPHEMKVGKDDRSGRGRLHPPVSA